MEVGGQGISVRKLGGDRKGEIRISRFLRNDRVTMDAMLAEASRRTQERVAGSHVLAIQDTTVIQSEGGGGHYLHVMIAVDADDHTIQGVIHGSVMSRSQGAKASRRQRPIEEKESYRWIESADKAAAVCAAARRITVIADRESDIFEAFARKPTSIDLLVRMAQDRALEDGGCLVEQIDSWPERGQTPLDLPARPGAKARSLTLSIRFGAVSIKSPKHLSKQAKNATAPSVVLNVVDVRELNPVQGVPPVHWRLLTTHKVDTVMDALYVVDLYRRRWAIEQLFRTLKTQGFDIEGIRIEDEVPRSKLVTAALIAAVSVQQLVHARDGALGDKPLRPMTDTFEAGDLALLKALTEKLEGKTARQKNPHPEGSLAYAAWVCARLGGWTGYYGKPGPAVMLSGWLRFQDAKFGASLGQSRDV
ncbi:IS4 family transposase [Sinorhizobium meliloti]|nr:IS4 family transposase [Sinorhizobium meliloti]UIJ95140.1 IS4 family transposase [Sinorhizobium meliloti]UIJ95441.1 IS4 family transposase [Sinorhizobium meliloti]WKL30741.1 IS4 family transposase [Sinorhizobium meliloti]WKL31601.1 IS4 family transposase [Sinorhizobium meliloti]